MKLRYLALILTALFFISCKQDPIFYIIAKETAPKKPRIEGAPTNMVLFKWKGAEIMIIASGKLHWYKKESPDNSGWDSDTYYIPQPGGKIISLAVTASRLYALCFDDQDTNTTLRYIESDGDWLDIPSVDGYPLQSIYADRDKEQLFAGARESDSNSCVIYYIDPAKGNTLKDLKKDRDTALLSGAVYRNSDSSFYLCTRGEFLKVNATTFEYEVKSKAVFMGMIKLEDDNNSIIAVERTEGYLWEIKEDGSFSRMDNSMSTGKWATGALCLWQNHLPPDKKMLIAGVQGGLYTTSSTSYSHGYVEFDLNNDNSFNYSTGRRETSYLQSVHDGERYTTSLGRHPINHLFQAPRHIDNDMTFFASTQTAGLWSYRDRPENDGWQWNAEE